MTQKQIALENLKSLPVKNLIELWDETENQHAASGMTVELAEVRGWLLDAMEAINPDAFDAWMEEYTCHPSKHFLT